MGLDPLKLGSCPTLSHQSEADPSEESTSKSISLQVKFTRGSNQVTLFIATTLVSLQGDKVPI